MLFRLTLASALLLSMVGCAASTGRYAFTADDFDMGYVDSQQNARNLQEIDSRVTQQFTALDGAVAQLASLAEPLPGPVKEQFTGQVTNIKGLVDTRVKMPVLSVCHDHGQELVSYLATYDVFGAKDSPYRYDLVERLKDTDGKAAELNPLIDEANGLLRSSFRVSKQLVLDKQLLDMARKDLAEFKTSHNATHLVGIGVIAVSVTRSSMACLKEAQTLTPRLQTLAGTFQGRIQADPVCALALGGPTGQLAGAVASLVTVPADVTGLLASASGLLTDVCTIH